jgi:hypothetical protein
MREDKTTSVSVTIEVGGKQITLQQSINNHELEEGVASLLNSAILLEQNLN